MISKASLVYAPEDTPVSLAEVKLYLKIDSTYQDDEITALIYAATSKLEQYLEMKFMSQTWDIYFDNIPSQCSDEWWDGTRQGHINQLYGNLPKIQLPFGKLSEVTFIKTYDNSDVEYTFDSANYQGDFVSPRGGIGLRMGCVWPSTVLRPYNGFQVRGVFGYNDQESVPQDIKQALKMIINKLFECRGDAMDSEEFTLPPTAIAIVAHYRMVKLGRR